MLFHNRHYLMLSIALLLSSCDFYGGVYRSAQLDREPVAQCVMETLSQVNGVTQVRYRQDREDSWPSGHNFTYKAAGVDVELNIEKSPRPEYFHTYRLFNTVPSAELINRLRPVMVQVDQALETRCHLKGLSKSIKESCPRGPFRNSSCKQTE